MRTSQQGLLALLAQLFSRLSAVSTLMPREPVQSGDDAAGSPLEAAGSCSSKQVPRLEWLHGGSIAWFPLRSSGPH